MNTWIRLCSIPFVFLSAMPVVRSQEESTGIAWLSTTGELSGVDREKTVSLIEEFFEVVGSRVRSATGFYLHKESVVKLSEDQAKRLAGEIYRCPPGLKPYLIRAVYGHGGTGRFRVKRVGEAAILVVHSSLGDVFTAHKSALIVNLDFDPKQIYCDVSIAR